MARYLVTHPNGDGVAAPTFEIHSFGDDPEAELIALAAGVATDHPALEGTAAVLESVCSLT